MCMTMSLSSAWMTPSPPSRASTLNTFPDVAEVDHAAGAVRPDVGGEDLDGGVAGLDGLGKLAHLRVRGIAAQHQMVGPIAAALGSELLVARLDAFCTLRSAVA